MSAVTIARLKITLAAVKPAVLRRIEVPFDIRLDRLHLAIQAAMGWTNSQCPFHLMTIPKREPTRKKWKLIIPDKQQGSWKIKRSLCQVQIPKITGFDVAIISPKVVCSCKKILNSGACKITE